MLDDLLIVPLLITLSIKTIPAKVMADARSYAEANPVVIKKTNWAFAVVIIFVWVLIIGLFAWRYLKK